VSLIKCVYIKTDIRKNIKLDFFFSITQHILYINIHEKYGKKNIYYSEV
jgi:hypothetical protein